MKKKTARQKIKDKLDKQFACVIRKRDKNVCQHCGVCKEDNRAMHVAHVVPKSRGLVFHWDKENALCLCFYCHLQWAHKDPLDFSRWFRRKYARRARYLEDLRGMVVKYTLDDLEGILEHLKAKK